MLVIFDFDSTIFNTKNFRAELARVLGISLDEYNKTSKKTFHNKARNYNIREHLETLISEGLVDKRIDDLLSLVNDVVKRVDDFLFPEANELIGLLENDKVPMVLLTRGDFDWQTQKVNSLKIKNKFSKIIVTSKNKSEELGFLSGYKGEVIIINDRPYETIAMADSVKQPHKYYIVKSKHSFSLPPDERTYELREIIEDMYGDK